MEWYFWDFLFGVLPFFVILLECFIYRSALVNNNGEKYPRIIFIPGIIIGLVPLFNFLVALVIFVLTLVFIYDGTVVIKDNSRIMHWFLDRN